MPTLTEQNAAPISLGSDKGFPYEAYCFTDGQLSLQMEKNGGLNELNYLAVLPGKGTFHPERYTLPILSKRHVKNYSYGLYGPVLRFATTQRGGPNLFHVPDRVRLLPFGFTSNSDRFGCHNEYDMCVQGRTVQFTFRSAAPRRRSLDMMFALPGLARGEFKSWLFPAGEERDYSPERHAVLSWQGDVQFDAARGCLHVSGLVHRYMAPVEPVCLAIGFGPGVRIARQAKDYLLMSMDWGRAEERHVELVFERDLERCRRALASLQRQPGRPWRAQTRRYAALAARVPVVTIAGHPVAGEMARTIPLFVDAMTVRETATLAANRAAAHKYGYFPHWDVQWTQRAVLRWGQYERVKKALNLSLTKLGVLEDRSVAEVALLLAEYYALSRDRAFARSAYARLQPRLLEVIAACRPNGLLPGGMYGADDPAQLKIGAGEYVAPDCSGWVYNCLRTAGNLARLAGDRPTAVACRQVTDRARAAYLKTFFDARVGYFPSAVSAEGVKSEVYQNVATLAMEGPYGDLLVEDVVERLAAFQSDHLFHPAGRSACPFWCRADEMWKSCIMLQNAHHEMRTLRFAGATKELLRMWRVYQDLFDACRLQIETINLCGMPGDPTGQRADWQAFAASAQYLLLFHAVLGIEADYRSLTYVAADVPVDGRVTRFRHGRSQWSIELSGRGPWVESFAVDGAPVQGALVAPAACFDRGTHTLRIVRGATPPAGPCVLRAPGAGVTVLAAGEHTVKFRLEGVGRIPVLLRAAMRPGIGRVNGRPAALEWNARRRTARLEVEIDGAATVEVAR